MTKRLNNIRLRQADESARRLSLLLGNVVPSGGWIKTIREALGMSPSQLGRRLGLSRQGVADLEKREVKRTVSLATLEKAAEELNAELVYAIVPRQSLAETIRQQARRKAEERLARVAQSMRLEAQSVSGEEYAQQLEDNTEELVRTWSREIWD